MIFIIRHLIDCIAAGRRRTFLAFDPRKGTILWESRSYYFFDNWNIYNPIILPVDLDNDGVNEIVISHGGNPTIPSNIKKRYSSLEYFIFQFYLCIYLYQRTR